MYEAVYPYLCFFVALSKNAFHLLNSKLIVSGKY